MAIHIIDEANRCLGCKKPMCRQGCPIHTSIPQIIQLFKEHKLMEAGEILFENNPMSAICSVVCNHEKQCEGNCVLGRKGNAVHFSSIENYISEMYLDRMQINEDGPVFQKSILDENGKLIGHEEEKIQVFADSTIISISQGPRKKLIRTTAGLEGDERGLLVVDDHYMTTKERVFAAGDVVTGSKTVVHAVEGAKCAVDAMIEYMENQ